MENFEKTIADLGVDMEYGEDGEIKITISPIGGRGNGQKNIITTILQDTNEPYLPLCLPQSFQDFRRRIKLFLDTRCPNEPTIKRVNPLVRAYYKSNLIEGKSIAALGLRSDWEEEQAVEVRQQLLSLTGLLSNITEANTHAIYYLDTTVDGILTYKSYMAKALETEGFFEKKVAEMRKTAEELRCRFLLRLRGELAIIEIASAKAEDFSKAVHLDSALVSLSSRYLGCSTIQGRLSQAKKFLRYGDAKQQNEGRAYVNMIQDALYFKGSKRSKRLTSYWGLYALYHKLLEECRLVEVHTLEEGNPFLNQLCDRYSLAKSKIKTLNIFKTVEDKIKALLIISGEFPETRTLPSHLSFGEARKGTASCGKTLEKILKDVPKWIGEYQGYMALPYIRFFDLPVQPGLDLLWFHEHQESALDCLERVSLP